MYIEICTSFFSNPSQPDSGELWVVSCPATRCLSDPCSGTFSLLCSSEWLPLVSCGHCGNNNLIYDLYRRHEHHDPSSEHSHYCWGLMLVTALDKSSSASPTQKALTWSPPASPPDLSDWHHPLQTSLEHNRVQPLTTSRDQPER